MEDMYRHLSELDCLIDSFRKAKMDGVHVYCSRMLNLHGNAFTCFERIRNLREYRTPRALRAFTKILIICMPIYGAPFFAYTGSRFPSVAGVEYYMATMVNLIMGALQNVQDELDDSFDSIGEDDIDVSELASFLAMDAHARMPPTPPNVDEPNQV
eukprot:Colp12_sorted_trinity150504_noHs@7133